MATKDFSKAIAYLRTSSDTNVGSDKDSDKRQRDAIQRFAAGNGYAIADEFYDADVNGDDEIMSRPGFRALVDRIAGNGVRVVIIESANRFARKLVTQELGIAALNRLGVTLLTASGENLSESDDPYRIAMRQMGGVFAELEKRVLLKRLKSGRENKKRLTGKCGGRQTVAERYPEATKRAKYFSRYKGLSLRQISTALAEEGHLAMAVRKGDDETRPARPFAAEVVKAMIEAKIPKATA